MRFSPQVVVHYETDWTEKDYRRARVGPWMHLAADRHRFQRRIREFDMKFGYIFTDIHREYMYDYILRALIADLNLND